MGKIDYKAIYDYNRKKWEGLTDEPEKYEALLAGHYSDSNHFIYELLQNAEDAEATKVVIECYNNKLVFYHNGIPFNEADVRGVSSMLMGTKSNKDSAQKIGHFGMGFKSVFKYTNIPEIYSDEEAFRIERYLLPIEINDGWDFLEEKKQIKCKFMDGKRVAPFESEKHLTKFVIPFIKKNSSGEEVMLSSEDVMKRLIEIDGRILLFLTHIRNLYWIEKETGRYANISLDESAEDRNIITCRIEGSEFGDKEIISRFLKFSKVFDHKNMKYCNVSVAYCMNPRANNINPMDKQCIWVYFPTKDETKLQFLVHGSFETAVSREKLMEPSKFNDDLYHELVNLICDSIKELKNRGLITQNFIRQVLIPSFNERRLVELQNEVNNLFKENALLPDGKGRYYKAEDLYLPVPYTMSEFFNKSFFTGTFGDIKAFVNCSDSAAAGFSDHFSWLKNLLKIKLFTIADWADKLTSFNYEKKIDEKGDDYKLLIKFYDFLSDYRESLHQSKRKDYYDYLPIELKNYDEILRESILNTWDKLRNAAIILNMNGKLVSSLSHGKPNVYLNSSSKYKHIPFDSLVDRKIAADFKLMLEEGFQIAKFDNFQYVKEKVIKKYIEGDEINWENTDEEDQYIEYIEDLKQISLLFEEGGDAEEIREMLKDACVIRVKRGNDVLYSPPSMAYPPKSDEGFDMKIFFEGISANKDPIDIDFYNANGISIESLKKYGLYSSLIEIGERNHEGSVGDPEWHALGDFCPKLQFYKGIENLLFIENHPELEISKTKSAQILDWILRNYKKLKGEVSHNKVHKRVEDDSCVFYRLGLRNREWLFDNQENIRNIFEISRYELNKDIYGQSNYEKEAYEYLGFATKEIDDTAKAFETVDSMDDKQQRLLLKQLARKYGYSLEKDNSDKEEEKVFSSSEVIRDFPSKAVKDVERLRKHIKEQFFCADPIRYERLLREIRTSKDAELVRKYVSGMYTNDSGTRICQMCLAPVYTMEATEIANFGIEMEQLNLCLCRNCSAKYKSYRDKNKKDFREFITEELKDISVYIDDDPDQEYTIWLSDNDSIKFTQTHLLEIKEIFELLDEYGIPGDKNTKSTSNVEEGPLGPILNKKEDLIESQKEQSDLIKENKPDLNKKIAKSGSQISFKKLFGDYKTIDCILQPGKYPLHKEMEGRSVGDIVMFQCKKYEIVGL